MLPCAPNPIAVLTRCQGRPGSAAEIMAGAFSGQALRNTSCLVAQPNRVNATRGAVSALQSNIWGCPRLVGGQEMGRRTLRAPLQHNILWFSTQKDSRICCEASHWALTVARGLPALLGGGEQMILKAPSNPNRPVVPCAQGCRLPVAEFVRGEMQEDEDIL